MEIRLKKKSTFVKKNIIFDITQSKLSAKL